LSHYKDSYFGPSIETFTGCLPENDTEWEIRWPVAQSGEVAIQKCPGGAESVGMQFLYLSCIHFIIL